MWASWAPLIVCIWWSLPAVVVRFCRCSLNSFLFISPCTNWQEPFLTSEEQDKLLNQLRAANFFQKFGYDNQSANWICANCNAIYTKAGRAYVVQCIFAVVFEHMWTTYSCVDYASTNLDDLAFPRPVPRLLVFESLCWVTVGQVKAKHPRCGLSLVEIRNNHLQLTIN